MPKFFPPVTWSRTAAEELLLLLLRPGEPESARRIRLLVAAGPDWPALLATAAAEMVSPLLHGALQGVPDVPDAVREQLRRAYLQSDALTLRSAHDLFAALDLLQSAGLAVAVLKGPVLAEELLGDAALLPAADIDLLVRRGELAAIERLLAGIGYRPAHPIDAAYLAHFGEVEFSGAPGQPPVECHYRLGHHRHFPISDDSWWSGAREVDFRGRRVPVLARDRSVLFAALHLFKHSYASLKHVVGFAAMLGNWREELNWEALFQEAGRLRAEKALLIAAALAAALLEPPLPASVRRRLQRLAPRERRLVTELAAGFFRPRRSRGAARARVFFLQHGIPGGSWRLGRWLLPPVQEVRLRYGLPRGSRKLWAYYLLNPYLMYRRRHL